MRCYRKWLLERVLIHGWTVKKCAAYLGRPYWKTQADFDRGIAAGDPAGGLSGERDGQMGTK